MHCLAGLDEEEVVHAGAHARRLVIATAALFMTGDFKADGTPHRKIPDFSWASHLERLTDAEFKQRYRLDPQAHLTSCWTSLRQASLHRVKSRQLAPAPASRSSRRCAWRSLCATLQEGTRWT